MKVFIDGLRLLRIESRTYIYKIELDNYEIKWLKNDDYNQFFTTDKDIDLHLIDQININDQQFIVEIGVVTLKDEFDQKYRYDGTLGCIYDKHETTFKLFSPVAKEVFVVVGEHQYPMTYEMPIWKATIKGNLEGQTYHYRIRLVNTFKDVSDPYANAASFNGNVIIDWDKTIQLKPSPIKLKNPVDAVIYEGHVRDLSHLLDVKHKDTFEGLIEHSKILNQNVLSYIKNLGITHLQLLPIYDFGGVFDVDKDKAYNWGYNPNQYFSVEGWFSKDPYDPLDRINSLKKVIKKAHDMKLGINMDVVYNHVYEYKTFPYDDIVPGYFYRHNHDYKMTNSSYCGNDVESRHYMVRKLIVDSLKHFASQFKMDGFRFDLMGLLDLDTMRLIEKELKAINPSIMLYGEGWNMLSEVPDFLKSNMHNQAHFDTYGHFNDHFRNTFKGDLGSHRKGYVTGSHAYHTAMKLITGSNHMFKLPSQSINYVACHDNLTLFDQIKETEHINHKYDHMFQDLANHIIAISQGVPFYHAGQEMYRSKQGVENSYQSPDEINAIHWQPELKSIQKLSELLTIRKTYDVYRHRTYNHDKVHISMVGHQLKYVLEDKDYDLIHYIKNDFSGFHIDFDQGDIIFNSQDITNNFDSYLINKPGVYIIKAAK